MKNKKILTTSLKILVSFLLLAWMFSKVEWAELRNTLQNVQLPWLLAALAWVAISVGISVIKWGYILKASKLNLPYRVLWKSYWAGLFFNNFLPSSIGGDGIRIYWTGKHSGDMPGATASVVVERVLATMGLCLAALLVAPFSQVRIPGLLGLFLTIFLVSTFILILILFPGLTSHIEKRLVRWPKVQKFVVGFASHGVRLRNRPAYLVKALGWSVIFQFCVVMVNWCIFKGLSVNALSFLQASYLIPATSIAAMLPVGVNGYGLREGAYMTLFSTLAIPGSVAMTASILFALIVSLASLWGGWVWIREGREVDGKDRIEISNREAGGQVL
jgi:hypothetical protein